MKSIGNIFKWIRKNKEWVFSGIGISILSIAFSMFINKTSVEKTDNSNVLDTINKDDGSYIEIQGDVIGNIYKDSINNSSINEDNDDNRQEIIMSESKYLEYLQSNVGGDILFYYYNDYDGDGTCEMFALIEDTTSTPTWVEGLYGKIWFINEDGIMEVESNEIEYWTSPYKFSVENNFFIAFEKAYTTGSQTFIWGVRDGKPYQPNISGKIHGLKKNEYDEIEVIHSTYDMEYDKEHDMTLGHTWKKYYFYFDGNTFREYGGINIEVEDIIKIPEIKKIINEIYNNSYVIDSIYYRNNHVININISYESDEYIKYYNISLRYINNMWKVVPSDEFEQDHGEGYYLRAFIPTVATYPDEYPY